MGWVCVVITRDEVDGTVNRDVLAVDGGVLVMHRNMLGIDGDVLVVYGDAREPAGTVQGGDVAVVPASGRRLHCRHNSLRSCRAR